jgi:hypothetical protein
MDTSAGSSTGSGQRAVHSDSGERLRGLGASTVEKLIEHHGIKGMKWGVRRSRGSEGTVGGSHGHGTSADAEKAREYATRAKKSGLHTLSNPELQHLVTRQNLETQYKRLQGNSKTDAGAKVAKEILLNVGKQHVTKVLAEGLAAATRG